MLTTLSRLLAVTALITVLPAQSPREDLPRFSDTHELLRPDNYREWIWLSSGLGMSYSPLAQANPTADPPFDNVFVNRPAYRAFMQTGHWPDKTVFVLELRESKGNAPINKRGHFQSGLRGFEVEVKDDTLPGQWAFYGFPKGAQSAKPIPATAACYSCHAKNGAVENTFVQFYPTLLEVARQKGTLKPVEEEPSASPGR